MRRIKNWELAVILNFHKLYLENKKNGVIADLAGAYLGYDDLSGAYLKGANLRGADLRGADLGGANLRGANLGGANLRGADLRGADLGGAHLGGANLSGAYLAKANLAGANLIGADLRGANLKGAHLGGAYLSGAKGILVFNKINGRTCYAVFQWGKMMVHAGCFWGSLEEFEKKCLKTYGDDKSKNYSEQIKYLKSLL